MLIDLCIIPIVIWLFDSVTTLCVRKDLCYDDEHSYDWLMCLLLRMLQCAVHYLLQLAYRWQAGSMTWKQCSHIRNMVLSVDISTHLLTFLLMNGDVCVGAETAEWSSPVHCFPCIVVKVKALWADEVNQKMLMHWKPMMTMMLYTMLTATCSQLLMSWLDYIKAIMTMSLRFPKRRAA